MKLVSRPERVGYTMPIRIERRPGALAGSLRSALVEIGSNREVLGPDQGSTGARRSDFRLVAESDADRAEIARHGLPPNVESSCA